eukprot:511767-Pyramimonas_sp.AAC.2
MGAQSYRGARFASIPKAHPAVTPPHNPITAFSAFCAQGGNSSSSLSYFSVLQAVAPSPPSDVNLSQPPDLLLPPQ